MPYIAYCLMIPRKWLLFDEDLLVLAIPLFIQWYISLLSIQLGSVRLKRPTMAYVELTPRFKAQGPTTPTSQLLANYDC